MCEGALPRGAAGAAGSGRPPRGRAPVPRAGGALPAPPPACAPYADDDLNAPIDDVLA
jgi:hypothetical protein